MAYAESAERGGQANTASLTKNSAFSDLVLTGQIASQVKPAKSLPQKNGLSSHPAGLAIEPMVAAISPTIPKGSRYCVTAGDGVGIFLEKSRTIL